MQNKPVNHPGRKRLLAKFKRKQWLARKRNAKRAAKSLSAPKCGFAVPRQPPIRKQIFKSFSAGEYVQPREIGIESLTGNAVGTNLIPAVSVKNQVGVDAKHHALTKRGGSHQYR